MHEVVRRLFRRAGRPVAIEPLGHNEGPECDGIAARSRRLAHDRREASGWLLERPKCVELVGAQSDRRRGKILLEMRYRGGPGNWQHCRGTLQQPGEHNLGGRSAMALGDPKEPRVWGSEPARSQRVPWDKGDTGTGACIDQPIGRSIAKIVAVLDRDDRGDGARSGKLPLRDVRHADVADLTCISSA